MSKKIEGSLFVRIVTLVELSFRIDPGNYDDTHQFALDLKEKFSGGSTIKVDVVLEMNGEDYYIRLYLIPLKRPIIEVNKFLDTVKTEAENRGIKLTISKS